MDRHGGAGIGPPRQWSAPWNFGQRRDNSRRRIDHHRNSSPRLIRLLGLGEKGGKVARKVANARPAQCPGLTDAKPVGWKDIATTMARRPDQYDRHRLRARATSACFARSTASPICWSPSSCCKASAIRGRPESTRVANVRGFSDLFVTTSDADYVSELIDNLAS